MRFLKELFKPKLKCERVGHNIVEREIKIRKEPDKFSWNTVVIDYKAKKSHCKRCKGKHSEPYDLEYIQGYNGCSMPNTMWDSIREYGYVEL